MLAGGHDDLFKGIAIVHPAMLDVGDVEGLKVPLALYPSKVSSRTTFPLIRLERSLGRPG